MTEPTASQEDAALAESTEVRDDGDNDDNDDLVDVEATGEDSLAAEPRASGPSTARAPKKQGPTAAPSEREPGKSLLPFSRVQKIMKADKDLPMVARDATVLISLATEEFIKRLSQACQKLAEREKRATVQQKDVASIVRRADEFLFLEEIIGSQESTGRRKPLPKSRGDVGAPGDHDQSQPTLLNFVQTSKENEDVGDTDDIVVNEDGTMHAG